MRRQSPAHLAGTIEGERRLVTVLFADLVGYTSASENCDPEIIQEALNLCFTRMSQEIVRFGGFVDKVVGDEIMALFGAPRAQEDDAGKAVACALAMRSALYALNPQLEARIGLPFNVRIGVNTGLVATGAVGPGAYTVTGDAVNVAARLEKAGEPGAVTVGETTRRLARRQFEWGERQELTVKGRAESVVCYTAVRASAIATRLVPSPSDSPFVGRSVQIERLAHAWSEVTHGRFRVVELVGESGIGKTRFLAQFFSSTSVGPSQVIYSRADTPPRTFGAVIQLLPHENERLSTELRSQLSALLTDEIAPPDLKPDWLVDAIVDLVTGLCRDCPVALVLDDIHRADGGTIDVIERLVPRLATMPVMLLLLRQPVGRRPKRPQGSFSITLDPLSVTEARALVSGMTPSLSDEAVDTIVARAGGNPLYLEVLTNAASSDGLVDIPQTLQTAVVARIDDLDPASRQILREASVFGQSFLEDALKRTCTLEDGVYDALRRLREVGLIDSMQSAEPAYSFRHALVQQVLYDGLLRRRRTELHVRAAEALELARADGAPIEPEQIAFHYERGGEPGRAATYHMAAAERADQLRARRPADEHRRAANRLIALASLADVYVGGRTGLATRATSLGLHVVITSVMLAPLALLALTRQPSAAHNTLGLPTDISGFNLATILVAVAIGGLPLLLAGLAFSHIAAPSLMRRQIRAPVLAAWVVGGWMFGLATFLLAFGASMELLRLGWLDRLSSLYLGGVVLRTLLGDYYEVAAVLGGTLGAAILWVLLLRTNARSWSRRRAAGPLTQERAGRWLVVGQLGITAMTVGLASIAILLAYEFRLLPGSDLQTRLSRFTLVSVIGVIALYPVAGVVALVASRRQLREERFHTGFGLIGVEAPLITALAFGVITWYGMRQAVIVTANDVDTPGDISSYSRVVDLFPRLGVAHYLLGERYLADNDLDRAHAEFDRAIEIDPGFPASYLPRGRILIEQGDYDAAITDGDTLIRLRPKHPGGYAIKAWAESQKGDIQSAARDFDLGTRPLVDDEAGWDAHFVRCLALAQVKQNERAKSECEKVLQVNPAHIVSLDQLIDISYDSADYQGAILYADRLLKIQPLNANALITRGGANLSLKRYDAADADYTSAIEIGGAEPRAYTGRATARVYLDNPDAALADAENAVRLDPSQRFTRLFVARYTGLHQLAIDDATALLTGSNAPRAFLLSSRGLSRLESKDLAGGLTDLNAALEQDSDYAAGYDRRGYAHFLLHDYAAAELDFDQALQRMTSLPSEGRAELQYHRALLAAAEGQLTRAADEIREAAALVEIPSVRRAIEDLRVALPQSGG